VGGLSFGFQTAKGGASDNRDGTVSLTAVDLLEVSVVAMPANRKARITGVKSLQSAVDLERGLRGEIPLSLPRGAAAKIAAGGWAALLDSPEGEDDSTEIKALLAVVKLARRDLKGTQ
jgi:hypothetical protein